MKVVDAADRDQAVACLRETAPWMNEDDIAYALERAGKGTGWISSGGYLAVREARGGYVIMIGAGGEDSAEVDRAFQEEMTRGIE